MKEITTDGHGFTQIMRTSKAGLKNFNHKESRDDFYLLLSADSVCRIPN